MSDRAPGRSPAAARGPRRQRRLALGAWRERFLTLREGSIIVVTVLAIVYFS